MSYILDALRRAEAERQRGAVPGLQDQPQPLSAPAAAPAADPSRAGLWALAAVGLLAAGGAAAWWWLKPPAAAPMAPVVAAAPAQPVVQVAPPSPPAPVAPAPVVPAAVSSAPAVAAAPATAAPALVLPPIPAQPAEPAAEPPKKPASRPAAAAPVAPVAPAPDAVRRQDLPENVRQQLPALTVAGATYSENPRYRMVIINGQVQQEGERVAPGVVLETIRPKEVVLRAQGYRFTEKY